MSCPQHGVVVAAVPWAQASARHTRAFEDTCAWLAARTAASVVAQLQRVSWRTVTAMVTRVVRRSYADSPDSEPPVVQVLRD